MPRPPRLARFLVIALAVAIPALDAASCGGRTACFTNDPGQPCPTPESINNSITGSPTGMCTDSIASVDGPGTLDGNLCCYPVTYVSSSVGVPCNLGSGTIFNGMGGGISSSSSSSGFGMGGFGTGGGTTSCVSCNQALNGAPFGEVCDQSTLNTLRQCACASACTSACDPTLCFGNAPDNGCLSCMQQSCSSDLMACQSN
jgi:hypothetical protein